MTDHDSATATMYRFAGRDYDSPEALAAAFAELGYPLNEQGLAALAAAVASGTPSHLSMDALNSAFRGDLLAEYGDATGQSRFREIDERWHAEFDAWAERVREAQQSGGPDVYGPSAWRARAWLLQAILRPEAEQAIRERAAAAMASPAAERPWFRGADDPKTAPLGEALAAATLADAAPGHYEPPVPNKKRRAVKWAVVAVIVVLGGFLMFRAFSAGDDDENPQAGQTTAPGGQSGVIGNRVQFTGVANVATSLYEEQDTTSTVVTAVEQFTVLEIMETAGDWYGVRIKEDPETLGWMAMDEIDVRCEGKCQIG